MRRLVAVAAALVLGGCAGIPGSGPVTEVVDDTGLGQSTVRYSPAMPVDGASPVEIVKGYLDAMLAYPASTRTAAAFLTPEAEDEWKPQAGVTVYSDAQAVLLNDRGVRAGDEPSDERSVPVTLSESGRLDVRGSYDPGRGGRTITYTVRRVDGQWRIADPQEGLLVTDKFFADYFRPFSLFFYDATGERLTTVPVHLPVDDRLAAALVAGLARGPQRDDLRTFVPSVESLRASVPIDDDVAEVGFAEDVPAGDEDATPDVDRLSAQVVWTLRQVPGLDALRIAIGPETLTPDGAGVQPITGWQEYDNGVRASGAGIVDGRVVALVRDDSSPIPGPWGRDAEGSVAVALTDDAIALVRDGRDRVTVGPRTGDPSVDLDGDAFLPPVADTRGRFWVVDRPGGGVRVRVVIDDDVRTVDTDDLDGLDVESFDVSPDGSRVVLTVRDGRETRVVVASVVRDADDVERSIVDPTTVRTGVSGPRAAVWSDDLRVAFLAGTPRQVHVALIDGSSAAGTTIDSRAALRDVDAVRLAVRGGDEPDSYVTDRDGRLWYLGDSGSWRLLDADGATSIGFGP